ncbi:MAG: HEAT repeat domain-containing protein, partial [Phycisphaerales bacterium]|nr:HEAT repeat domain-containing protein [Phycisphaerales bacterium]
MEWTTTRLNHAASRRRIPLRGTCRSTGVAGLIICALVALCTAGCDTLSSDLAGLGNSFSPPSPGQAARWMIDPTNAENRRRGTVIIANSSLGAVPVNVAWYRDRAANERDPMVLAASLSALARYGTPDDAALLTPHLEHTDVQVRWAAARGLQRLHNPESVGP